MVEGLKMKPQATTGRGTDQAERQVEGAETGREPPSRSGARQQNRELTSEDTELRQSRKNSGKTRDREQEM